MPTPAIQTLLSDAQQILNLNSLSEVRSTMAAALANANVGTPLNPNLTTQQLWDEFYLIVRQPESDIESIITNQLMKFLYSPPAPGGAGADKQVIFNDGGVLAGSANFLFNKATNLMTVTGSATITGDLGVGTASPSTKLEVATATANTRLRINSTSVVATEYFRSGTGLWLVGSDSTNAFKIARGSNFGGSADYFSIGSATADCTWFDTAGGTRMTLNSGGLAIGTTTNYGKLSVAGSIASFASNTIGAVSANSGYVVYSAYAGAGAYISFQPTNSSGTQFEAARIDTSGNVGIGVTPSAWTTSYNGLNIGSGGSIAAYKSANYDQLYVGSNFFENTSGAWRFINNGYATQYWHNSGSHVWRISTTSNAAGANQPLTWTQAMTLDASGNLLVGTTSASNQERLNVSSALSLYVARVFNTASSGGNYGIQIRYSNAAPNNATNEFLACSDNAASRAFIYANGGLANYQANDSNLSDARTKTDIKPLASYWNKIKSLEVVTFKYKDQTHSDDNIGLIAQQVESVAPEFVSNEGFGEVPEDGVPLKTIYTTDLYHAAIKALQEAMTRIEALEAKLA